MRHLPSPRLLLSALLVLPLTHCSCQRQPAAGAEVEIATDATLAGTDDTTVAVAGTTALDARAEADAAALAASTLHAYLGALPDTDRRRADAYWAGGKPGTPTGDALLRGMTDLHSMRIQNDPPLALDHESPPRAFEIPVRLRLDTNGGPLRVQGTYRMRARVDGQGWEITSASLQPALD